MSTIERMESEVRSYCRVFPATFTKAEGCYQYDDKGNEYLDFFSGAGTLNYGHNNPQFKAKLIEYIQQDGVVHSLDMTTAAKIDLLERFESVILKPRGLDYKVQFPGPTGTNAVESALKLARKIKGRQPILSFTNAFHGMTLGSLSISGNAFKRDGAGVPLAHAVNMPFDGYFGDEVDTIEYMDRLLNDNGSGIDTPAAAIVETVQAEGGINVASFEWLQRLETLCRKYDMLLILDDIQVGCGRTGPFFSFEPAGIYPDMVCLSKSLSGYGLPLAFTLIRRELDQWQPGEHNGTFRGHNLAFITATEALSYWEDDTLSKEVQRKGHKAHAFFEDMAEKYPNMFVEAHGRGLIQGLECRQEGSADKLSATAFERGLIAETSGPEGHVFKLLPPLTIEEAELEAGLQIIEEAVEEVAKEQQRYSVAVADQPSGYASQD